MDTSETYVKMCEKAEEIQGVRIPPSDVTKPIPYCRFAIGDWTDLGVVIDADITNGSAIKRKVIWLPRQDQLQEMITSQDFANYAVIRPNEPPLIDNLLSAFEQFCHHQPWQGKPHGIDHRPTMEQLWLAFVMHEKYAKSWDGNDWKSNHKNGL